MVREQGVTGQVGFTPGAGGTPDTGAAHVIQRRGEAPQTGQQVLTGRDPSARAAKEAQTFLTGRLAQDSGRAVVASGHPSKSERHHERAQQQPDQPDQPSVWRPLQANSQVPIPGSVPPEFGDPAAGAGGDSGDPPPPEQSGPGFDEEREQLIQRILERNKEALEDWQWDTDHKPRLDMPDNAIRGLIPEELLRHPDVDPERVDIKVVESKYGVLSFFITQVSREPIPKEKWEQMRLRDPKEPLPEGVDPMLGKYAHRVVQIGPMDIPLVYIRTHRTGCDAAPDLYIDYVEVNEKYREKGIAGGLHRQGREFAAGQGFHNLVAQGSTESTDTLLNMGLQRFDALSDPQKASLTNSYGSYIKTMNALIVDPLTDDVPTVEEDSSALVSPVPADTEQTDDQDDRAVADELPAEQTPDPAKEKERNIWSINKRNKEALRQWQQGHVGEPTLDLTKEATKGLIPERLLELVDDPEALRVVLGPGSDSKHTTITIVERRNEPVTDVEAYRIAREAGMEICPPGVDPMVWQHSTDYDCGLITAFDKPLFYTAIFTAEGEEGGSDLFIHGFEVHPSLRQKGVAKDAYKELRIFARQQGFECIACQNSPIVDERGISNLEIFTRLGNIPYDQLPVELKPRFAQRYADKLNAPEVLTINTLEPQTIVEKHANEWPDFRIENFYSPHYTKDDMSGLQEALRSADIYLIEGDQAWAEVLQIASRMDPRNEDADGFIDHYNASVTHAGNPPIFGTWVEAELRAVYGTGIVVGQMDVRPGDAITREEIIEVYNAPYTTMDFATTLENLADKYATLAEHQEHRQAISVNVQLEKELTKLFGENPHLLEIQDRPLTIVKGQGSLHKGMLDRKMHAQGIKTNDISAQEPRYSPSYQVMLKFMRGEQPTHQDIARAHLENIMSKFISGDQTELSNSNQLALYLHYVTSQFSIEEIAEIHGLLVNTELTTQLFTWHLAGKGFAPLPKNDTELDTAIRNFEAQRMTDREIVAFANGTKETQTYAAIKFAEVMATDADLRIVLDTLSVTDPVIAQRLATHLNGYLAGRMEQVTEDNLIWMYANLPSNINTAEIQTALRDKVDDDRTVRALLNAANWAEYDDKTIARINNLAMVMDVFEENVLSLAENMQLDELLRRQVKPGERVRDRELRRFNLQPVIAQKISKLSESTGTKMVLLSRTNDVTKREYIHEGDGPLGLVLSYRGVPQGLVSFDTKLQTIYIRQFKETREYFEPDQSGQLRRVEHEPDALQHINFPGVAIELVAEICDRLAIPRLPIGEPIMPIENPQDLPVLNPTVDQPPYFQPLSMDRVLAHRRSPQQPGIVLMVNVTDNTLDGLRRYGELLAAETPRQNVYPEELP